MPKLCTKAPYICCRTPLHTIFEYGDRSIYPWPYAEVSEALGEHLMGLEPGRYFWATEPETVLDVAADNRIEGLIADSIKENQHIIDELKAAVPVDVESLPVPEWLEPKKPKGRPRKAIEA